MNDEAAAHKQLLSAEIWNHRQAGQQLRWLGCVTADLTSGARNEERRRLRQIAENY